MARYECERCGVVCFTTNPPHLCADIAKRLARREKQVAAVEAILDGFVVELGNQHHRDAAEAIVAKLSQMGVTDDA